MTQTVTHSLAAKYYTDPEVFRIEQDGLYGAHMAVCWAQFAIGKYLAIILPLKWQVKACFASKVVTRYHPHILQRLPTPRAPIGQRYWYDTGVWCAPITRGPMN